MQLDIESQVRKLGNQTNLQTVISEAVVNSIQAGATKIDVVFEYSKELFDVEEQTPVTGVVIRDNGRGFTQDNINSFCVYGSRHKIDLGCKGVGRLCFLKVFDQVDVKSDIPEDSSHVTFTFNIDFEKSSIQKKVQADISASSTELKFSLIRKSYEKPYDIVKVRNQLYNHVLPMLYLNRGEQEVEINFFGNKDVTPISTEDLPEFERSSFNVQEAITNDKKKFGFTLHYAFEGSQSAVLNDYYCANGRTVFKFNDRRLGEEKIKITPISGKKITLLLTGEYLDNSCNEERNEFGIYPRQTDMSSILSWSEINSEVRPLVKKILEEKSPIVAERNVQATKKIREDFLHLSDYLDDLDSLGGAVDTEGMIRKAEKRFLDDKLDFRKKSQGANVDRVEVLHKASDLAGKELIEYVLMRDRVISSLEDLHNTDESSEDIFHDLLLKKGLLTDAASPVGLDENNIWLLDDKFMSYCYAASDKTIRVTGRDVGYSSASSERPDLAIFFQNESNNHNAVVVELKGLGVESAKKFAGLLELREYADTLKAAEDLDTIWYYLITKIDEKFEKQLKVDGYKQLFSMKEKTYFRYYDEIGLNLYILSSDTLIADAKARNKTFIDLVRGNSN